MKIACLDRSTASIMIFRMMCQKADINGKPYDIPEVFKIAPEDDNNVEILITVNGVEVDPIECLETCWEQLDNHYEERATELAKKMISLAGLSDLQDKLSRAEWEIGQAVDNALEKLKG